MPVFPNVWRHLELLLAVVLICLSLIHIGRMGFAMATNSLSTDEFGTVGSYSAKGPIHVITDYSAPKNHVFFNLLNSLLPGRESWEPARVRALSILATVATALALVGYAIWRRRWLEGAILLAFWSAAPQALSLSMEARGYGFLDLFGLLCAISTLEYLRHREVHWLWALGASVVLGVYTVPGFLFFAAPLMLLLWLTERNRTTFFAGVATVAAILVLYAPLLLEVYAAFTGFHQDKAEADFQNVHGWVRAVKLYLYQGEDWMAWSILGLLAISPFLIASRKEAPALRIVAAACVIYLVLLLALKTPPPRMAAFSLIPLGLAGIFAIGGRLRETSPQFIGITFATVVSAWAFFEVASITTRFRFVPSEDWTQAGRAIDMAYPKGVKIDRSRAKYLRQTLPDGKDRFADFELGAFSAGQLVVAEAGNKWAEGNRFHAPPDISRVVQWTIPGTIRDIVLTFRLPENSGLPEAPTAATDGRSDTGTDLHKLNPDWKIPAAPDRKALILLLNRPATPRELAISAPEGALFAGDAVVIPLASGRVSDIRIDASKSTNLDLMEAWISR